MFTSLLKSNTTSQKAQHEEGELYKVITAHGVTFELYYGYYEEIDRQNPNVAPMEMYPNFIENPVYTDKGIPFVTAMQKPCQHYNGDRGEGDTCYQCGHYEKCEELLGVCNCKERRK